MTHWQRLWSCGTVTAMWLLSNLGVTWAHGDELRIKPDTEKVTSHTHIYLTPSNSFIIDSLNQPSADPLTHYSHSSHSSHRSHASHYSGTGTTYTPNKPVIVDVMEIRAAQKKLNDLGYDAGVVDGIKGQRTIDAIKLFQEQYGLDIDGIIGQQTKQVLDSISLTEVQRKLKELGYTCDTYGTRDAKTIDALAKFQSDYGLNNDAVLNLETKKRLDSISILDVQKKLKQMGFNCDTNGVRDDRTVKAIIELQKKMGLESSGVINEQTRNALGM